MIREEEPPRPSRRLSTLGEQTVKIAINRRTDPKSLRALVNGEIDWIVMKSLDKDRKRKRIAIPPKRIKPCFRKPGRDDSILATNGS